MQEVEVLFRTAADDWAIDRPDIKRIRAFGNTPGGKALSRYVEGEVEGAMEALMTRADATDVASVAYAQGQRSLGRAIWDLLNADIDQLLMDYNQEEEDESSD